MSFPEKMASDLVVLQYKAYGSGLLGVQRLLQATNIEILELVPVGDGLVALLTGIDIKKAVHEFADEQATEKHFFEKPSFLRALYSLETSMMRDHLLVLESPMAGRILYEAERALAAELAIVDLKLGRGTQKQSVLLLTSATQNQLQDFADSCSAAVQSTFVANLDKRFKKYFEIAPRT